MKRGWILPVVAVLLGLGMALAHAMTMPGPNPDALWRFISKEQPYTSWGQWDDHRGVQPGAAPHGRYHKVFVNKRGIYSPKPPVQYGTIVVKENYAESDAKDLKAITVMYKMKDYNPEAGDWYWAKYMPNGEVEKYGRPQGCIDCHAGNADYDYIMVHGFGEEDE